MNGPPWSLSKELPTKRRLVGARFGENIKGAGYFGKRAREIRIPRRTPSGSGSKNRFYAEAAKAASSILGESFMLKYIPESLLLPLGTFRINPYLGHPSVFPRSHERARGLGVWLSACWAAKAVRATALSMSMVGRSSSS